MTTMAGMWETLEFDFSNEVMGTAAINFANTYDKISIFFNFGTTGADAGEKTYYWDDMEFVPPVQRPDLPITFEDTNLDYDLVGFGNAAASVVTDPTDGTNMVGELVKSDTAELWAGVTIGDNGLANAVPVMPGMTKMTVRVWSPDANIPIRLKIEDATNPAISVETETMTTMAGAWETLEFDFSNEVMSTAAINFANTYDKISIFFNFGTTGADAGEKTYYWDDMVFVNTPPVVKPDLPITFEDTNLDYNLVGFGNAAASIVTDPTDGTNMVGELIKSDTAELWAGATMGGDGLENAIPFAANATRMSVRVWSPDANIPVRLKVEAANNPAISVETEAMTTMAGAWELLIFDFSNEVMNTAALNLANTYDKVSIFFNFGTTGADAGEKTYYWDNAAFISVAPVTKPDLPITFEDTNLDYNLVGFGNAAASIITDPTDGTNMVGELIKSDTAELWAGATMGGDGLASAIPFMDGSTKMTVRVWSPDANIPVRLKAEAADDATISVETEAMTTMAGTWETLEFDFSNEVMNTAAINFANTYDKLSIFFNFGTTGADAGEKTYYWDDVNFVTVPPVPKPDLPITFEDTNLDYNLVAFGNAAALIITDPTDGTNMVGELIKSDTAELWAGVTMGGDGLASAIPFMDGSTKMTVRVWSPDANIPVRLKAEAADDATISVETEAMTTVAGTWETLEFDFSNEVMNTAAINFANTYDKLSIFFNFGTTGADAGVKIYYWDDVNFVTAPPVPKPDLPITFEDTNLDYNLVGFGNAAASIVTDPTDGTNMVGELIKSDTAELWAGVTMGGDGLASAIPFMDGSTKMTVRVWSPDANIPVRLKAEAADDATISVETEAMTTMAGTWETLEFDFSNEVMNTAAINFANTYDKLSIFFNFGTTGADAGEKDVLLGRCDLCNGDARSKARAPNYF